MDDELEKLRKIYLADTLDEDERAENEQTLREWSKALRENKALATWQTHDVTRRITKQTKQAYKDMAVQLATNRNLTQDERTSIWAKQDAMQWLLSILDTNAAESLAVLESEVKQAVSRDIG